MDSNESIGLLKEYFKQNKIADLVLKMNTSSFSFNNLAGTGKNKRLIAIESGVLYYFKVIPKEWRDSNSFELIENLTPKYGIAIQHIANFVISKQANQKGNRNAFQIEFLKSHRISKSRITNDTFGIENVVLQEKDKS